MAKCIRKPVRVGLVGEDDQDHDYSAIKALLERQYGDRIQCVQLGRRLKGDKLATKNKKACDILEADFVKALRPVIVVYSRDLDSAPTNTTKLSARQQEFDHFNTDAFARRGILLLHIFGLEALIMADISAFNKRYNVNYRPPQADAMRIDKPKDKLKNATDHRYEEAHAALILAEADYDCLLKHCRYFADFDAAFSARLAAPRPQP